MKLEKFLYINDRWGSEGGMLVLRSLESFLPLSPEHPLRVIADRFRVAISTIPEAQAWLHVAALLLLFTIIALPIGFQGGFLQIEVLRASWRTITGIIAMSLFMPAIAEELFFRVFLLPQTTESLSAY